MKTVDLNKVLEMLINEEHTEATGLLHEWFVETSKKVHEDIMAEDNSLSQDIEDDQEAIKSEEFYGEADEDSDAEGEEELDGDVDAGVEGDVDADAEVDGEVEVEAPASPEAVADTIEDLEAVMARLKAEFAEITGADVGGEEVAGDEFGGEDEVVGDEDLDEAVPASDIDPKVDRLIKSYLVHDYTPEYKEAVEFAKSIEGAPDFEEQMIQYLFRVENEMLDRMPTEEGVTESEDDFADLEESWNLEPVKDPNLQGGKEIGADGAKVHLNDKSPLPEHDADARVGGKAVEIKSDHHEGHEREAAPEVKSKPLLKNQVKKSTDGRTKVSKEGDKSAMLNSKAGFGSDSPKSPIGQATDLRGSDFKRK